MIQAENGQRLPLSNGQGRFTAERVARTRPKTYRAIVRLLAEPDAKIEHIAQRHHVSTHTVRAIRAREAVEIAERKKQLVSILADVATLGSERMVATIGKASLRDAAIGTGIALDKILALTGRTPVVQIANVIMPSEEDGAERRAIDERLDAIARRLADTQASE
jgi:transposase-like protein